MSNSLVHKSLELLGYEKEQRLQGESKKKRKKHKDIKYEEILDLIPVKHRFVSKNGKTESSQTSVYKIQKHLAEQKDPPEENVQLLLFGNNHLNPEIANNLLQHDVQNKFNQQQKKPKKLEQTVFTEENFKKFEQEYVE
ncbi:active regulator of SIRT1-like [Solenopsis invicta]|uniref:active regulator of SIRT1-like n=1 Tax=Solenopsis invicta TaxID=13686 RepID=UPI00193D0A06|nr:active regulator of SIRT1-like [Solenopsis invicta]